MIGRGWATRSPTEPKRSPWGGPKKKNKRGEQRDKYGSQEGEFLGETAGTIGKEGSRN